jgi:hypothetical protein
MIIDAKKIVPKPEKLDSTLIKNDTPFYLHNNVKGKYVFGC